MKIADNTLKVLLRNQVKSKATGIGLVTNPEEELKVLKGFGRMMMSLDLKRSGKHLLVLDPKRNLKEDRLYKADWRNKNRISMRLRSTMKRTSISGGN